MPPDEQPCASMWKVIYADDSSSHLHMCELPPDHGLSRSGGPIDHRCQCGATYNGHLHWTCTVQRDGHSCTRIYWHANYVKHRCHCGRDFSVGLPSQRPLVVRSSQPAPGAASPRTPSTARRPR